MSKKNESPTKYNYSSFEEFVTGMNSLYGDSIILSSPLDETTQAVVQKLVGVGATSYPLYKLRIVLPTKFQKLLGRKPYIVSDIVDVGFSMSEAIDLINAISGKNADFTASHA